MKFHKIFLERKTDCDLNYFVCWELKLHPKKNEMNQFSSQKFTI
jgi:hypothetical protein